MSKAVDFLQTALSCKFIFDDGSEKNTILGSDEYKQYLAEVENKQVVADVPVTPEPDVVQPSVEPIVEPTSEPSVPIDQDKELEPPINSDVVQPTADQPQVTVEPETSPTVE